MIVLAAPELLLDAVELLGCELGTCREDLLDGTDAPRRSYPWQRKSAARRAA
jgi:hypothetical protein